MSVMILTIADAVVDAIEAATLSQTVDVERVYVPSFDLHSSEEIQVKVVPKADTREPGSHTQDAATLTVDIGIFKKLADFTTDTAEISEVDDMLALCDELRQVVNRHRLTGAESAVCSSIVQEPIYSMDATDGMRTFLTVLTCTFITETDV